MTLNNEYSLKSRQVCLFFIAFMPITKLFMMPSILAGAAKEDMWLSTLFNTLLDGITLILLIYLCKKSKLGFFELLENNFGKTTAKIVFLFYSLYFFIKSFLPIFEEKNYIELTLYETAPSFLYFIPFFAFAFFISIKKLRVLGRVSDILWISTLLGLIILISLSIKNVDFGAILPIGAQGLGNVLKGSYFACNWFGDCVYLLFFVGKFDYRKKDGIKILLSYLLSALGIIIFSAFFYCIFTFIAHRQTYALTEISKYSTAINHVGRFDYLGIILLLFSGVFSMSLPLYFCVYTFSKAFNISNKKWIVSATVTIILLFANFLLGEYVERIKEFLITFGSGIFILFSNIIPCLTLLLNKENKLSYANI